jgi:hypothetical protein
MFCSVLAEAGVSASPLEVDRALSWAVHARAAQAQQIAIARTLGFSIEGSSVSASALALFSPPAFLNAADFLAVVLASLNRGDIVSLTASDVSEDVLTTEESSEDAELSATDSQVVQLTSTDRNIE